MITVTVQAMNNIKFSFVEVDGRIVLKWISKKMDGAWAGLSWLRIGTRGGLL
jgi:hypothetical protein